MKIEPLTKLQATAL